MSVDTPNPARPQTTADAAAEIATFFNGVETRAQQRPHLSHESGICQFNISGVGSWLVSIKDGMPTLVRDADATRAAPPGAVFTCSPDVFLRILHREDRMNAVCAALQGLIEISGDPALAVAVLYAN
jgi:hypothetical protein